MRVDRAGRNDALCDGDRDKVPRLCGGSPRARSDLERGYFELVSLLIGRDLAQFYARRSYGFLVTSLQAPVCFAAAALAVVMTLGRVAYAHTCAAHLGSTRSHTFFGQEMARLHTGENLPCHISHHPRDGSRAPRRVCPKMIARAVVPQGGPARSFPRLLVTSQRD